MEKIGVNLNNILIPFLFVISKLGNYNMNLFCNKDNKLQTTSILMNSIKFYAPIWQKSSCKFF